MAIRSNRWGTTVDEDSVLDRAALSADNPKEGSY
jgi:hypothetical protein